MSKKALDRYDSLPHLTSKLAKKLKSEKERLMYKVQRLSTILKKKVIEDK